MSEYDLTLNKNLKSSELNVSNFNQPVAPAIKTTTNIPVAEKNDSDIEESAKYFGLTIDEYKRILLENPNFVNLSIDEQKEYINKQKINNLQVQENTVSDISKKTTFNDIEFEKKSVSDKIDSYAYELVKNKYTYGDSKQKFENLSQEKIQTLVEQEKKNISEDLSRKGYENDNEIDKALQYRMTSLQAANRVQKSFDNYQKLTLKEKAENIHDYIAEKVTLDNEGNFTYKGLTDGQKKYIKEQSELSNAIVAAYKRQGMSDKVGDGTFIYSPQEIQQNLKELNTNKTKVQIEYLEEKKANGQKLTNEEEEKLIKLKERVDFADAAMKLPKRNYGRLEALKKSEKFGELLNSAKNDEEKIDILYRYAKTELKDDKTALQELMSEVLQSNDELATKFHKFVVQNSSVNERGNLISAGLESTQLLNADNINEFDENEKRHLATGQEKIGGEFGETLASISLNCADESTLLATKDVYSAFKSQKVQINLVNASFDPKKVSASAQNELLRSVNKNSSLETRIYAGTNLDKAYKENQLPLQEEYIKDKDVNDAMVAAGTFSRFDKENQTQALKNHKDRYEQDDYSKEDAVKGLNTLSDQIQYCDKENQLDMHNEMMTSRYSEVQEHVASNIKNYDPSVQAKAFDSVVASGNQKAVENAITSLASAPARSGQDGLNDPAGIKPVLTLAYSEDNAVNSLQEKIANGETLTPQEYNSLSLKEQKEYKAAYFKTLSPAKQIKILSSLTDRSLKLSIYRQIASSNKDFLKDLIENDASTAEFIYENIPQAGELVLSIAQNKSASDIKFANLAKKINSDFEIKTPKNQENPKTARSLAFGSIPEDLRNQVYGEQSLLKQKNWFMA